MSQQAPLHVLRPGQQLSVRFREATGLVLVNLKRMRLTPDGGNALTLVHVTFVDARGVSLYIARGFPHGGDMEAFLPARDVMWQAYFTPLNAFHPGYAGVRHYTRRFPADFL